MRYVSAAILVIVIIITACSPKATQVKQSNGWISLFNGKDMNDWFVKIHHHEVGDNYRQTFRVEDGIL